MRPASLGSQSAAGDATPRRAEATSTPRVVALGGGTGLPNVLRGLRPLLYGMGARHQETAPRDRLVAIVATSDDGGSSGRLRAEFNMIPPGDIRNCLAALSDNHALIADIFQYRFDTGEGLNGHAIGNLVLAALADVTQRLSARRGDRGPRRRCARHRAAGDGGSRHAGCRVRGRPGAERRDGDLDGRGTNRARQPPARPAAAPAGRDAGAGPCGRRSSSGLAASSRASFRRCSCRKCPLRFRRRARSESWSAT